jgi:hypothetical protein
MLSKIYENKDEVCREMCVREEKDQIRQERLGRWQKEEQERQAKVKRLEQEQHERE